MLSVFKRKKKKTIKSEDDASEGSETADVEPKGPEETIAEAETSSSTDDKDVEEAPAPKPARPKLVNDQFRQGSKRHMSTRMKSSRAIASDKEGAGEELRRMKRHSKSLEKDDVGTTSDGEEKESRSRSSGRDAGGSRRSSSRDGGRSRRSASKEPSRPKRSSSREARRKPRDRDSQDVLKAMYGDPNAGSGTGDKEDATENIESPTKSKEDAINKTEVKLDPSESANGTENIESPTKSKEAAITKTEDKIDPSESANGTENFESPTKSNEAAIEKTEAKLPSISQDDESASNLRKPRRAVRGDGSEAPHTPRGGRRSNRDGLKIQRSSSRDVGRRRHERTGIGEVALPLTRTESKDGQSEVEHRSSENKDGGKEVATEGIDGQKSASQIADAPRTPSGSTRSSLRRTLRGDGQPIPGVTHTPTGSARGSSRKLNIGGGLPLTDSPPETPGRASRGSARRRLSGDVVANPDVPETPGRASRGSARRRLSGDVVANADVPETPGRASRGSARRRLSGDVVANADVPETSSKGGQRSRSREPGRRSRTGEGVPTPRSSSRDPGRRSRGKVGQYHSPLEDQAGSSSTRRAPRSSSRGAGPRRRANCEGGSVAADQSESPEADKVEPGAAEENNKSVDEPKSKEPEVKKEDEKEEPNLMPKTQEPEKDQITEEVSTMEPLESVVHEPDDGDVMQEKDSSVSKPSSEANPATNLLDYIDASYQDIIPKSEHQPVPEKEALPARPSKHPLHTVDEVDNAKDFAQVDELFQSMGKKKPSNSSDEESTDKPARPSKHPLHTVDEVDNAKDFAQVDELFQSMGKKKPSNSSDEGSTDKPRSSRGLVTDKPRSSRGLVKGKAPAVTGEGRKIKKAQSAWDMMGDDNDSYEGGDPERKELAPPSLAGDRGTKKSKIRFTKASGGYDDEKNLPPPSLAGDEYRKTRKASSSRSSKSKLEDIDSDGDEERDTFGDTTLSTKKGTRKILRAPSGAGLPTKPKDIDSDGDEERDTFGDTMLPTKKSTRKILRAPSGEGLPAQNLAPPSLAGDEQRIDDRKLRKKASSKKFSELMDSDGDNDSVGDFPETEVVSKPKSIGRGMMTKARSVTNVLKGKKSGEPRKLKKAKKAVSLRHLAI